MSAPQDERDAAERRVEVATDLLRWSMDLRERMRRRVLIGELVDAYADTADLEIEAEQFKRICRALSWGRQ